MPKFVRRSSESLSQVIRVTAHALTTQIVPGVRAVAVAPIVVRADILRSATTLKLRPRWFVSTGHGTAADADRAYRYACVCCANVRAWGFEEPLAPQPLELCGCGGCVRYDGLVPLSGELGLVAVEFFRGNLQ